MRDVTIIVNDAPYGSERPWNALRLAKASIAVKSQVNIFLMGDAVTLAKKGQRTPEGYYNLEKMLVDLIQSGAKVFACGTCMASRGLGKEEMVQGVEKGTMMILASTIKESRTALSF